MNNKRIILILSIVVIILLCVSACIIPVAKHMYSSYMYFSGPSRLIEDEEQKNFFEKENRADFDEVNNIILSVKDSNHVMQQVNEHGLCNFSIKEENGEIVDLSNFPIKEKDKVLRALNQIVSEFKHDFSYIQIEGNFINYGGIGPTMYKYSINGEAPTYFFEENEDLSFTTYKLSEHWYYLEANVH